MGLSVVPDPDSQPRFDQSVQDEQRGYTPFQGKEVTIVTVTVKGTVNLPLDRELRVDDLVKLSVEGRVTGVNFIVNEKDGRLERRQQVKVIDVEFGKWDPNDPLDSGVMR